AQGGRQQLQTEPYAAQVALGVRIRTARARMGWSLGEVARRTGLSRAYVNALELGRGKRPGADAIRRLEDVLGSLRDAGASHAGALDAPDSLRELARERNLAEGEIRMLAGLKVRGLTPATIERWRLIYDAL